MTRGFSLTALTRSSHVTRPSAGQILRPLIAVLLTAYVLWRANPSSVAAAAGRASPSWILAAILLVVVDRGLMAYRWIALLCPIDPRDRPPLRQLLRVFFVSTFVGTFLPASIGGDVVRAYGLSRLDVARGAAVASVLMDRLLGVVSIVMVGAVALVLVGGGDVASNRTLTWGLLLTAAACVAALAVVFSAAVADLAQSIIAVLPVHRLRLLAGELAAATRAYATHHGVLTTVVGGSVAVQILRIVQAYCLGRAIGIDAGLSAYFAFIPMILLVMLLPISINGIGTSQAAFVWFFARAAVPAAEAFALSVMFVALGVVGNLPGGILYAFQPTPTSVRP